MVIVLDKITRDIVGIADTIAECRKMRREHNGETDCQIVGIENGC